MKTIGLLLVMVMLAGMAVGCINVSAPKEIKVDAGNENWNDVANRYARQYGSSDNDE